MSDSEAETYGFFNISEDLVELPVMQQAGTLSIDFDGLLDPPLQLHEDLAKGCGGRLWPAGVVLSKYMLQHRDYLRSKTMQAARNLQAYPHRADLNRLELGAGGGLVG
jgi:hypothetical protein